MADQTFPGKIEIGLSTGIQWAKKYRNSRTDDAKKIDGYLIPIESLEAVLKLKETQKIDSVRAYIGISESGEQNLIFVGAKLDAKTGIYKDVFASAANAIEMENVVYDGSRPCPPCADPESPMYV
jgi:hypothetical protein